VVQAPSMLPSFTPDSHAQPSACRRRSPTRFKQICETRGHPSRCSAITPDDADDVADHPHRHGPASGRHGTACGQVLPR
jgi:hypothetical protein